VRSYAPLGTPLAVGGNVSSAATSYRRLYLALTYRHSSFRATETDVRRRTEWGNDDVFVERLGRRTVAWLLSFNRRCQTMFSWRHRDAWRGLSTTSSASSCFIPTRPSLYLSARTLALISTASPPCCAYMTRLPLRRHV